MRDCEFSREFRPKFWRNILKGPFAALVVKINQNMYILSGQSANAASEAWVTLATNDSYALGALVLARSLRRSGTFLF